MIWLVLLAGLLGAGAGWVGCAVFGAAFGCGHQRELAPPQHVRGDLLVLDWSDAREGMVDVDVRGKDAFGT